jgi:sarcosine oxidase subunit alpha
MRGESVMVRLPKAPTQRIDREREIVFNYKGKPMKGLEGDTIATALFAEGVRIFSRSMKYHRPRGLYNLDGYSSHCLMGVDGEPNVRACRTPLRQGMVVKPQNVIGSPEWDLMSVMQWFGFAMPVGFYYKVFHKPAWLWKFVEPVIRRAAGFGVVDPTMPDGIYENRYLNAEVCIVGGGPAGMRAALEAARSGVRVILLETKDQLGGALNYRTVPVNGGAPAFLHSAQLAGEVLACENIRVLLSTWRPLPRVLLRNSREKRRCRHRRHRAAAHFPEQRYARNHAGELCAPIGQHVCDQAGKPGGCQRVP